MMPASQGNGASSHRKPRSRGLTVVLTGVRGTLGGLLAERLSRTRGIRRIVLLDLLPPETKSRRFTFYRLDLTDPLASTTVTEIFEQERPDVVVHTAFLHQPTRTPGYAHELESLGTMELCHGIAGVRRMRRTIHLVLGSSTWVYGARPDNPAFLTEEAPLRGMPGYPLVQEKVDAERQVFLHHERTGRPVTVLRFAPLLSPGIDTLTSRYLSLPRVPTVLGYNPMIQTLAVEDALDALLLAVRSGHSSTLSPGGEGRAPGAYRVYNITADGTVPILAAVHLAGRRNLPIPPFGAGPILDGLFAADLFPFPSAHVDFLRYPCLADGAGARHELGFRPTRATRETLLDFRSHGRNPSGDSSPPAPSASSPSPPGGEGRVRGLP